MLTLAGGLAVGLLNFGDRVGKISAGMFTIVGAFTFSLARATVTMAKRWSASRCCGKGGAPEFESAELTSALAPPRSYEHHDLRVSSHTHHLTLSSVAHPHPSLTASSRTTGAPTPSASAVRALTTTVSVRPPSPLFPRHCGC